MKRYAWLFAFVLALSLAGFGCGKKGGAVISGGSKAFDSNPAVKEVYQKAMATLATNDYVGATLLLQSIQAMPNLAPEQTEALKAARAVVDSKMYEGVNKGDANAKKALEEMRKMRQR
jgi:hypothetical protein